MQGRKTKVLLYCPTPPPYAGPEIATKMILDNLKSDELEFIHLQSNIRKENWDKGKLDSKGMFSFLKKYIEFVKILLIKRPKKVYLLLSSGKIGFLRDSVLIITSFVFGKKIAAHYRGGNFHNFYKNGSSALKFICRMTLSRVNVILVQAEILKFMFDGIYKGKIEVLYNGVEAMEFKPKSFNRDGIRILFMGHLSYAKGFYHFIEAYKSIYKEYGLTLYYAGSKRREGDSLEKQFVYLNGENLEFYKQNARAVFEKIDEFFRDEKKYGAEYLGVVSDGEKEAAFGKSDLLILPSITEGFSMTVLEAMQRGMPVIVTKVGALPEVVKDGENGFLINETSIDLIKTALLRAISDKRLLSRISQNNVEYVKERFDVRMIANELENILIKT